jgi:hypothetical protein
MTEVEKSPTEMAIEEAADKFREIYTFINYETLAVGAKDHHSLVFNIALDTRLSWLVRSAAIGALEARSFAEGISEDGQG